jgi:CRP-like cAMP-binding protein
VSPSQFKNKILRSLDADVVERLELRPRNLPDGLQIEHPGETIRHLVFIEDGVGSMTTSFEDGFRVQVGMLGVESAMGASALIGTRRSLNRVYMHMAGYGFSCSMSAAVREFERCERFQELLLRSVQAQLVQTSQSAGCNSHHSVRQRLSRWLLLYADRSESNVLALTQEDIADMLGVVRSSVSLAAEGLQRDGLIQYMRGRVIILNRTGLEEHACECYRVVRNHLDNLHEFRQE